MRTHRRKWGWWLVMAIAVAVAASLFYRRCTNVEDGPAASATGADATRVVRDTVFVQFDGEAVPVVKERPAEPAVTASAPATDPGAAQTSEPSSESVPASTPESASAPAPEPASAETVIAIPVSAVTNLIRQKSGRDITLTTKAPDHIDIAYAGKVDIPVLGEQNMDFTAGFKVVEVQDDRLVLQMDSGTAKNIAIDLVAPLILERLPAGLVESFTNGRAVVNLSAIPQYRKGLSGVTVTGITVDEGNVRIATVKK